MKRKIYLSISILNTIAILITSILLVIGFYNFYISSEKSSIQDYTHIIASSLEIQGMENIPALIHGKDSNLRATIVDNQGDIVFDTSINPSEMENHGNRIEIKSAFENGTGESIRHSNTIGRDTYYYAVLLTNNRVLRISRQTNNIFSIFISILPNLFIIISFILLLSLFISSLLTNKILKPVEDVTKNIERIITGNKYNEVKIYDELVPFIRTVSRLSTEIELNIKDLQEKADIIDVITSNMKEGLIMVDNNRNILSANHSGVGLLSSNQNNDYINMSFISLCRDLNLNRAINKTLKDGENQELVLDINRKYISVFINPVFTNDTLIGAVILLVDTTEKHKVELIRQEFSANVSHELKTPLTSINGYAEMIENGMAKDEDINKFATIIRKEGSRLLNLIDSIIRLSEIEEKGADKVFTTIDIYNSAQNIIKSLSLFSEEKDISLELYGEKTLITANPIMIDELLTNLIENSIKYTNPGGQIKVEIRKEKNHNFLIISDNGIGISLEDQDRIFERFYMVDKTKARKTQSKGLGLSIVKHIVKYHDGHIDLISAPGKGTKVIVRL